MFLTSTGWRTLLGPTARSRLNTWAISCFVGSAIAVCDTPSLNTLPLSVSISDVVCVCVCTFMCASLAAIESHNTTYTQDRAADRLCGRGLDCSALTPHPVHLIFI